MEDLLRSLAGAGADLQVRQGGRLSQGPMHSALRGGVDEFLHVARVCSLHSKNRLGRCWPSSGFGASRPGREVTPRPTWPPTLQEAQVSNLGPRLQDLQGNQQGIADLIDLRLDLAKTAPAADLPTPLPTVLQSSVLPPDPEDVLQI